MAPPANTPRLIDLDPVLLAAEAARLLLPLRARIDGMFGDPTPNVDLATIPLVARVEWVVRYARGLVEAPPADALDTVRHLADLLGTVVDLTILSPLGCAVAAAEARALLGLGKAVPRALLAALAGVNERRLRQVIETRELKAPREGDVPAKPAKVWLAAREVLGFSPPAMRPGLSD